MITTLSLLIGLAGLAAPSAEASPLEAEHFTVGVPAEIDMIGLAFGVHPELLWRPFSPEGRAHVRASTGAMFGPELALVPVSLGVREVFFPTATVRPGFGMGVQFQNFLPYGHSAVRRLDQYYEFTLDARVRDGWRVAMELSPEFGWIGGAGAGIGMAARLGVMADLPLAR